MIDKTEWESADIPWMIAELKKLDDARLTLDAERQMLATQILDAESDISQARHIMKDRFESLHGSPVPDRGLFFKVGGVLHRAKLSPSPGRRLHIAEVEELSIT